MDQNYRIPSSRSEYAPEVSVREPAVQPLLKWLSGRQDPVDLDPRNNGYLLPSKSTVSRIDDRAVACRGT